MSQESLNSLRDYIQFTLSIDDLRWLTAQLTEFADQKQLMSYTNEELHDMVAEGEKDIAEGRYYDSDALFNMLEQELGLKEEPQLQDAV